MVLENASRKHEDATMGRYGDPTGQSISACEVSRAEAIWGSCGSCLVTDIFARPMCWVFVISIGTCQRIAKDLHAEMAAINSGDC